MALDSPQTNGWWGRPLWTEIDLDALAYNVASLKGQAGPAAIAAVVKANAYGHGAVGVAQAALEAGGEGGAGVVGGGGGGGPGGGGRPPPPPPSWSSRPRSPRWRWPAPWRARPPRPACASPCT